MTISSHLDEPTLIAFYCRHCDKIVKAESKDKREKYSFACLMCHDYVMYGTARSLIRFLKIKEHTENGQMILKIQEEKIKNLNGQA